MPREPASRRSPGAARARGQVVEAKRLAARLTRIGLEARRIAASVVQGAHGRRRPGVGESFWQFRPFMPGEAALLVDWRRSAREERLFVREREWEGAQTFWLWADRSRSMEFKSHLAPVGKADRALVLMFATAEILVRNGERVGLIGATRPSASRSIIERLAEAIVATDIRGGWRLSGQCHAQPPFGSGADRRFPRAGKRDRACRRAHGAARARAAI